MLAEKELKAMTSQLKKQKVQYKDNPYFDLNDEINYKLKETDYNSSLDDILLTYDVQLNLNYCDDALFDTTNHSNLSQLYYQKSTQIDHCRFNYLLDIDFIVNLTYEVNLGVSYNDVDESYHTFYSYDDIKVNQLEIKALNVDKKLIDLFGDGIINVTYDELKNAILEDLDVDEQLKHLFNHNNVTIIKIENYENHYTKDEVNLNNEWN